MSSGDFGVVMCSIGVGVEIQVGVEMEVASVSVACSATALFNKWFSRSSSSGVKSDP